MFRFRTPPFSLALAVFFLTMPAHADDLDPWQGLYVGADLGALVHDASVGTRADQVSFDDASAFPAFHVGYDFGRWGANPSGGWLVGFEVDTSIGDVGETKSSAALGRIEREGSFIATARLRAGYAWDRVYLYGTAGLAVTDMRLQLDGNDDDDLLAGGVYGIGIEYRPGEHWSTRIETLGYTFDDSQWNFDGLARKAELDLSTIRIGASYRF